MGHRRETNGGTNMPKKTPYDRIPLVPAIVAEAVCSQPYTGAEWSEGALSPTDISKVETARQKMTQAQIREFSDLCERRCRAAYEADTKWIVKCAKAKGNRGRDQLYVFVSHWLASYLHNPTLLRRSAEVNLLRTPPHSMQ
jgi:hypothetical protein